MLCFSLEQRRCQYHNSQLHGNGLYCVRHEFFYPFKFAAIFILNPIEKRLEDKIRRRQRLIKNTQKCEFFSVFEHLFGAQNEASPQDPRAYVPAKVGAVIR